jgi:hypothetical protein
MIYVKALAPRVRYLEAFYGPMCYAKADDTKTSPWLTACCASTDQDCGVRGRTRSASDLIWIKAHVREAGHRDISYLCDGG